MSENLKIIQSVRQNDSDTVSMFLSVRNLLTVYST